MNPLRLVAVIMILLGVLGLVYGGFIYITDTRKADIGPLSFSATERENVTAPVWAGIGAIAFGGVLFFFAGARRQPW